jgi:hypothetical protein
VGGSVIGGRILQNPQAPCPDGRPESGCWFGWRERDKPATEAPPFWLPPGLRPRGLPAGSSRHLQCAGRGCPQENRAHSPPPPGAKPAGRQGGRQAGKAQHSTAQHSLVSLGCARLTVLLLEMGRRWPAAASQPSQADDGTDPIHNLLLSEYMHSCMHTVSWVLTPRIASTR